MTKNLVTSEQRFFGLGFNRRDEKYTYFKPSLYQTFDSVGAEAIYTALIQLDMNVIEHSRSIYTWWDFLGDVGGLFEMLQFIAYPFIIIHSFLSIHP